MERPVKAGRAGELFNLGIAEFNKGHHPEALASLRQASAMEPGNATYACFYGQALYYTGDFKQAQQFLRQAAGMDPDFFLSWKYLGLASRNLNDVPTASEAFGRALELQPSDVTLAQLFMENIGLLYLTSYSDWIRKIILLCLQVEDADHQVMGRAWADFFMLDPAFADIRNVEPASSRIPSGLNEAYLNRGLQRMYACSMPFERVMTKLRHLFLNKSSGDLSAHRSFLCSLSTQMWLNEYIYLTTSGEEKSVAALKTTLEQKIENTNDYAAKLCLYGCYAPLTSLKNAEIILATFVNTDFGPLKNLLRMQIAEPLEERELKKTIKTSATITDDVSQAVRAQYESNPYPRWRHITPAGKTVNHDMDILIAGCGTGMQTALCAELHPNAHIHSIDLSLNSLAYAKRQTQELGFEGLTFEQADILSFDPGNQKYDLIECTGVLHHMKNPDAGLKALLKHLKPDGTMWLGLYSAKARHDIAIVRKLIADGKIKSQDLKSLRQEIADHPDQLVNYFIYKSDFYTTSSCCDLIWHAQEYHFTLPEIEKLLADNNLKFGEFFFMNKAVISSFQKLYPQPGAEKDLKKWHEYEQRNPALFAGMYVFTVSPA